MPELPPRLVTRLTRPFVRFMQLQASAGFVLLGATVFALVAANTPLAERYTAIWNQTLVVGVEGAQLSYPFWYWINDGLMAVFFFVVGLEIKRELVSGELRDRRNVVLPALAAVGGAVVPIGIFLLLQSEAPGRAAWAVPMATDIAFVVACLALLGERVPPALKIFMLSLAIIDDLLAVIVIAVAFSASLDAVWLAASAVGLVVVAVLNKSGVRAIGVYVLAGTVVWTCMLKSGLHPTLAGVILGLMTPARAWIRPQLLVGVVERGLESLKEPEAERDELDRDALHDLAFVATESVSPLERLEHALHPWVAFAIMPIFALANAGVAISVEGLQDPLALAIIVALVIGKPVGIAGVSWLVIRMRLARLPERTSWPALVGGACLGGIGFTMALFIASLSVGEAELEGVKAGVLGGSALSMILGLVILRWAIGRTAPADE